MLTWVISPHFFLWSAILISNTSALPLHLVRRTLFKTVFLFVRNLRSYISFWIGLWITYLVLWLLFRFWQNNVPIWVSFVVIFWQFENFLVFCAISCLRIKEQSLVYFRVIWLNSQSCICHESWPHLSIALVGIFKRILLFSNLCVLIRLI